MAASRPATVDATTARAFRLHRHHLAERLPADGASTALQPVGLRTGTPGLFEASLHARVAATGPPAALDIGETVDVLALHGGSVVPAADVTVFTLGAVRGIQGLDAVVAAAIDALADGPLPHGELSHAVTVRVPKDLSHFCRPCGCEHVKQQLYWNMVAAVPVVPGPGGLLDRADRILGRALPAMDAADAQRELVRRFLRAHAPATVDATAWWLSVTQREARARLASLGDELVALDYDGAPAYVLARDVRALAGAEPPEGVRLVPAYDPFLTTADRGSVAADPGDQATLWRTVANSGAVVADGDVVAAWRARKHGPTLTVTVQRFAGWQPRHRDPVAVEAEGVAAARGCALANLTVER